MKTIYTSLVLLTFVLLNTQLIYPQWVQTNGPGDGYINLMAANGDNIITKNSSNEIYLSTNKGTSWEQVNNNMPAVRSFVFSGTNIFAGNLDGVFITSNNGVSWIKVNDGLTNTDVRCLAIIGTNIFAGTFGGGVFMSDITGINWTQVNNGLIRTNVNCFAQRDSSLIAGTDSGGVFITTDSGTNWTQINNGLPKLYDVTALAATGSNIIAISSQKVYRSTDNGTNWSLTTLPSYAFLSLAVIGTNIYAGQANHFGDLYRSTNNGADWQRVMRKGLVVTLATDGDKLYASVGDTPDFMIEQGLFLSTDFGDSWTQIGLPVSSVTTITVNGNNIFAGTYLGVFHSTNPDGTILTNAGLTPDQINALILNGNYIYAGTSYAGASGGGLYISSNNGKNWLRNSVTPSRSVYSLAQSGVNIFAGIYNGEVVVSTDSGSTWTLIYNEHAFVSVNSIALSGTNIFIGGLPQNGTCCIDLSTNNGVNWIRRDNGIPNTTVYAMAISDTNIFAGTAGGVYLSTDNGANWVQKNNGLTSTSIRSFAFSGSIIFAGTAGGVFQSTNNGSEWTQAGLNNLSVFSLAVTQTHLLAGTYRTGLWYRPLTDYALPVELTSFTASAEKGSVVLKWNTATELNNMGFDVERSGNKSDWGKIGFVNGNGNSNSTKNYFFDDKSVSNAGKYFYRLKQVDNNGSFKYSSVAEVEFGAPSSYALNQNYPNPFNPSTMISYRLKEKGFVKLKVYGIKGELVKVLVNDSKDAGYYESEFDGKGLASGVYIYRLEVIGEGNRNVYSDMKKTVLLK